MHCERILAYIILAAVLPSLPAAAHDKIKTVIGGGPNGIPGLATNLPGAGQLAVDLEGNLYIAVNTGMVYKLTPSGVLYQIAGDGTMLYDGDSGPALKLQLGGQLSLAVDRSIPANVFIADQNNCLVRKLDQKTSLISTVAGSVDTSQGTGPDSRTSCGYSGDNGPASAAQLGSPKGITINPLTGDLYFIDGATNSSAFATGTISTVAGVYNEYCASGGVVANGATATATPLCISESLAIDASFTPANLVIADPQGIDEVVAVGTNAAKIYHIAGLLPDTHVFNNNVTATQATFGSIVQIQAKGNGVTETVQAGDTSFADIRQFTVTFAGGIPQPGMLTTIAGSLGSGCNPSSVSALDACFSTAGLATDALGNYFISNGTNSTILKVSTVTGDISDVVAWDPQHYYGFPQSNPQVLLDSLAQPALDYPDTVFADPDSNKVYAGGGQTEAIYVWDSATTRLSDFTGNGIAGFAGDGTLASAPNTQLSSPAGMAKDSHGNLYIADAANCRIRVVDAVSGDISTFAGGGSNSANPCGYSGDGSPALDAQFNYPNSIAFDPAGNLFIADTNNCVIREVDAHTNLVSTVAGAPDSVCTQYYLLPSGDGGPANQAQLCYPMGVSLDGAGNLYIADYCDQAIREVFAATGIIQTVAGTFGNGGFCCAGGGIGNGSAVGAILDYPSWVKADKNGNLFIADTDDQLLYWVTPDGQMIAFGGSPMAPPYVGDFCGGFYYGDGGSALSAVFNQPTALDQDSQGNFYVVDSCNNRIRQISAFSAYGLSTASLAFPSQQVGTASSTQTIQVSAIGPTKIGIIVVSHPFKLTDNCANTELAAGQTCQIQVTFNPQSPGNSTGRVKIYSDSFFGPPAGGRFGGQGGNPDEVTLSGYAHN